MLLTRPYGHAQGGLGSSVRPTPVWCASVIRRASGEQGAPVIFQKSSNAEHHGEYFTPLSQLRLIGTAVKEIASIGWHRNRVFNAMATCVLNLLSQTTFLGLLWIAQWRVYVMSLPSIALTNVER